MTPPLLHPATTRSHPVTSLMVPCGHTRDPSSCETNTRRCPGAPPRPHSPAPAKRPLRTAAPSASRLGQDGHQEGGETEGTAHATPESRTLSSSRKLVSLEDSPGRRGPTRQESPACGHTSPSQRCLATPSSHPRHRVGHRALRGAQPCPALLPWVPRPRVGRAPFAPEALKWVGSCPAESTPGRRRR